MLEYWGFREYHNNGKRKKTDLGELVILYKLKDRTSVLFLLAIASEMGL